MVGTLAGGTAADPGIRIEGEMRTPGSGAWTGVGVGVGVDRIL